MSKDNAKDKETNRIEAFSDGVFAIAITLLVLNIQVPHSSDLTGSHLSEPGKHWATYIAFFIGSFSILVCWINHHHICNYILRCDTTMQILNSLIFLVVITFLFSTSLFAEYIGVIAGLIFYTLIFCIYFFPENFARPLMKFSNKK